VSNLVEHGILDERFIANARSQLEAELETSIGIMATIKA
jgi:hypothetical protein